MESWSFDSKAKMGSMDWESKSPFIFGNNNMVFSHNAIGIHQGFEDTFVPQILGNSLLSPIHNEFLEEFESSSEQSGSVVESDLIVHTPSKQKRIRGSNSSAPLCKVHGCNKSLVSCKDYHRRHKVCESHSKTAKVIVNGIEQRFCQQCSRFHLLSEFDEGKRSCRKRLADHNERRRKPHSGHHGRLLPPYSSKGIKFKGSSTRTRANSSSMCNDLRTMSSVTDIYVQQYPSLYGDNNGYAQASSSVLFPYLNEDPTGGEDDFITIDSKCALSLLSSQSLGSSCDSSRNAALWPLPLSQNTHEASGVSDNMNPLVGSEYMNSENGLWCDEVSTIDLLQLSSQLDRVELNKEIFLAKCQNGVQ